MVINFLTGKISEKFNALNVPPGSIYPFGVSILRSIDGEIYVELIGSYFFFKNFCSPAYLLNILVTISYTYIKEIICALIHLFFRPYLIGFLRRSYYKGLRFDI